MVGGGGMEDEAQQLMLMALSCHILKWRERDPREHSGLASFLQVQGKQMGKPQNTTLVHLENMPGR